ncbi:MAG: chromosome segregation protein SMC [Moraxella sp.]|nr:chromosome segregation protein SMC [Moraxella sp.]
MRLKSLKLAGFKSFANPTTFSFKHDITAIVGPNGCGKSNVIDAIRWVLGEMSAKQLRGGAMSDVIFAGVDGRAAKSLASVELTFEHTQDETTGIRHALNLYQELTLRRQITRDGKSDYFINGQRVRRRDVVDVFLGTGLGARSYAVIEQGMIGRIIDADGVRLREFIEEAAGVSRYQVRRDETWRQLGDARDNLIRLDDLQGELAKQQKSLERQAKSAKRYQEINDELHSIEGELLIHQLYAMTSQLATQTSECSRAKQALTDAQTVLNNRRSDFDKVSARLGETAFLRDEAKDSYHAAELAKNTALHALTTAQEKCDELGKTLAHHQTDKTRLQTDIDTARTDIATHEQLLAQDTPAHKAMMTNLQQYADDVRHAYDEWQQAKRALSAIFEQKNTLSSAKSVHSSQHNRTTQALQKWTQKHNQHQQQLTAGLDNDVNTLRQRAKTLQDEQDKCTRQLEYLQDEYDTQQPQFASLMANLHSQKETIITHEKQYASLNAKYSTLHALVYPPKSKHDKPPQDDISPNAISGIQQNIKSIIKLTAQGEQYAKILDGYLASYLDDKLASADEWQAFMTQLGECTDEPVNETINKIMIGGVWRDTATVENKTLPTGVIALSSLITPALPLWRDVYLLTDAVHNTNNDTNDTVQSLLQQYPYCQLLTMTGWLIDHRGAVALHKLNGGMASNYLAQRKAQEDELAVLEEQLTELEDTLETLQKTHRHTQSSSDDKRIVIEELSSQIKQLETHKQTLQHDITRTHASIDAATIKADNLAMRADELAAEKAELESELTHLADEQVQLDNKTQAIEQALAMHKNRTNELANIHAHKDTAHKQAQQDSQALAMRISLAHERLAHAKAVLDKGQAALETLDNQHSSQEQALLVIQDGLPQLENAYQAAQQDCHTTKIALDEYEQTLKAQQHAQLTLQKNLTEAHTSIATHQAHVSTLMANVEASQVRLHEIGETLNAHTPTNIASLLHDFAQPSYRLNHAKSTLTERQSTLMAEQTKLGAVNLAAAAELDEINARLAPMDTQIVDIKESIKALEAAIATIDEKTKGLFVQTLAAVNQDLNALFTKVFGGGQASLSLVDDDNLPKSDKWRAGLVLMAQPKGKKNSRLAVLSGGEKTLTALSLIFAIFKQHPAPFCVLDEVDAPLDDANVGRFTSLIHELADDVQFIFISHNKLAMQTAHELKGITMPTAGISSLVTVDLAQAEQYLEPQQGLLH